MGGSTKCFSIGDEGTFEGTMCPRQGCDPSGVRKLVSEDVGFIIDAMTKLLGVASGKVKARIRADEEGHVLRHKTPQAPFAIVIASTFSPFSDSVPW